MATIARDVTALVPCFNAAAHLPSLFRTIERQDCAPAHVLFIDDGSTDETEAMLRQWCEARPGARVVRIRRSGLIHALNRGLKEIDTELVARFDVDDTCVAKRLRVQLETFRDPNVAVAASDSVLVDAVGRRLGRCLGPTADERWPATLMSRNPIPHSGVIFRRSAICEVGAYNPNEDLVEDLGLWLRVLSAGWKIASIPEALTSVLLRRGSASNSAGRVTQRRRANEVRCAWLRDSSNSQLVAYGLSVRPRLGGSDYWLRNAYDQLDEQVLSGLLNRSTRPRIRALPAAVDTGVRRFRTRKYR